MAFAESTGEETESVDSNMVGFKVKQAHIHHVK